MSGQPPRKRWRGSLNGSGAGGSNGASGSSASTSTDPPARPPAEPPAELCFRRVDVLQTWGQLCNRPNISSRWAIRNGVRKHEVYFSPYDLQRMFDRAKEPTFLQRMYDNASSTAFSQQYDDTLCEQHAIINDWATQTRRDRGTQTGQSDTVDQGTQTDDGVNANLPLNERRGAVQERVYRPRI